MKALSALLLATLALAGCDAVELPTAAPATPRAPAREMSHWPTGGLPGFHFTFADLPPGVPLAPFDATLSPVVEVCRVTNGSCGPVLATFTRTTGSFGRLVTVDAADQAYRVTWPTGSTGADPGEVFRVSVRVGTRQLGFMDVLMVTSWWQLFTTDTSEFYPWVAGVNLTVGFRIERGIPGSVQVSASSLSLNVGEGRAVSATVLDLHGQPIPTLNAKWWIYDPVQSVSVDSGMVIGVTPGTTTISAWYGDVETIIPVTVTDTRRAWTAVAPPEMEARAVWGASQNDLYTATHTGIGRWNGTAWSFAEPVRWRSLYDVRGFGAGDVWAVGDNGIMVHWDGAAWNGFTFNGAAVSPQPLNVFEPPARRITLRGIWGASPSALVAVGDSGTVLVYNGAQWSTRPSGTTATLTDVWGTSATDFYATTSDGRVLRFGATSVSPVAGVQAPGQLNGIWGSSSSNVYAVGDGGLVYRFNGSAWSRVRIPTRATLYTVWGSSASEVYVAGAAGALYRYNGTAWTPEKRPGGDAQIFGVWGLPGGPVYAVGSGLVARR